MRSKSPTEGCCGRIEFPNLALLLWTALIFCLILVYQQPAMIVNQQLVVDGQFARRRVQVGLADREHLLCRDCPLRK